ncbi:MAG: hypothetical protein AAFZ15_00245 [Bacteroidota bacterium]
MKKIICAGLVLCYLLACPLNTKAQIVYGSYNQGGNFYIAAIDLATCTVCNVFELPTFVHNDFSILDDGSIVIQNNSGLTIYPPASGNPITIPLDPPSNATGSYLFNGLLYIFADNGLHYFDPSTNQVTYVGPWPPAMPVGNYEFFELNNQIYALRQGFSPNEIWLIDLADPVNSTFAQSITGQPSNLYSSTTVGNEIFFYSEPSIYSYNFSANTETELCNLFNLGIFGSVNGLSYLPAGVPPPPCLCTTDAGTVQNNFQELCIPEEAIVPFNNDETLDSDDLLQYILFSDLLDTLGSILVTSNTPNITFDPNIMQPGVIYYLATIAGDDINGNVDLTDDCLSISNGSEVIWRPQPAVSFSIADPDLCAGSCIVLNVTFIGTPPFSLEGNILSGANVIGNFNEAYNSNNGTLEVCAPVGTSPGDLNIQSTLISDEYCTCE